MFQCADGMYRLSGRIIVLWCLLTVTSSVWAQSPSTGALTGTTTDSSGAVVANAMVTITSLDTNQSRTETTGADGTYKFSLLPPGNYRVKFEAAGFETAEIPSAVVDVTETEVLNRALEVGAQSQEVTVQADVETIQTASSALGTVVNAATVTDLPLNTRNYTNLLAMSSGASANVNNATALGKGSTLIAVNGGSNGQNNFQQDGVPVDNWYSFGTGNEGVGY